MRMVVSAKTKHPIVWKLTKCENLQPLGIQTLTFYQNYWNDHTDYLEKDSDGNIIGAWADYYKTEISPTEAPSSSDYTSSTKSSISASTSTIKSGGSYKTLTLNVTAYPNDDVTSLYSDYDFTWNCFVDDEDMTDVVTWRDGSEFNQKKLKLPLDRSKLGKILKIKCCIQKDGKVIESEILELEIIE